MSTPDPAPQRVTPLKAFDNPEFMHSTFARSSLFSREVLRSTALVLCGARGSRWIIPRLLRLPGLPGEHDHPRLRIVLCG